MRRSRLRLLLAAAIAVVAAAAGIQAIASPRSGLASEPGWRTVFVDQFDGGTLDRAKWNTCYWWHSDGGCTIASNHELEWYRPSQVSLDDGALRLTARKADTEGAGGKTYPYRSGMVTTGPPDADGSPAKFAFTYGRVEARLRVPAGTGLWSALWLLPASRESLPEIDILEVLGNNPRELLMHLHPKDDPGHSLAKVHTQPPGESFADGWRDVVLDWEPGRLTYYVDGQRVWQVRGAEVPDEPMYLVANLAVGGSYPGPPDGATKFPATYQLDYIRVQERA